MVIVSSNFSPPVEGILSQTPSTKLLLNDQVLGTGTLYITENNVVWGGGVRPSGVAAPAVSMLYPCISAHGIQRAPSPPALYVLLNIDLRVSEAGQVAPGNEDDEDDEFDADEDPTTQVRFIPENENDLQDMFSAMTQGLSLHPDTNSEDDEKDEAYMDGEEFDEGGDEFEDAEEAPEENAARLHQMRIDNANGLHQLDDSDDAEVTEE